MAKPQPPTKPQHPHSGAGPALVPPVTGGTLKAPGSAWVTPINPDGSHEPAHAFPPEQWYRSDPHYQPPPGFKAYPDPKPWIPAAPPPQHNQRHHHKPIDIEPDPPVGPPYLPIAGNTPRQGQGQSALRSIKPETPEAAKAATQIAQQTQSARPKGFSPA